MTMNLRQILLTVLVITRLIIKSDQAQILKLNLTHQTLLCNSTQLCAELSFKQSQVRLFLTV